jgi:hypothetical protein
MMYVTPRNGEVTLMAAPLPVFALDVVIPVLLVPIVGVVKVAKNADPLLNPVVPDAGAT